MKKKDRVAVEGSMNIGTNEKSREGKLAQIQNGHIYWHDPGKDRGRAGETTFKFPIKPREIEPPSNLAYLTIWRRRWRLARNPVRRGEISVNVG